MKKKKQYKVKTKRPFMYKIIVLIVKIFNRRPKLVNYNEEEIAQKSIFLLNHYGVKGPIVSQIYFPVKSSPWGASEMCGSYRVRWKYLYYVFYRQKLHWNKFKAFNVATFFAIISKYIYNSIGLIPTYPDMRLVSTIQNSVLVLDSNISVVIFPENSADGYHDKAVGFHNGFVLLASKYFKKTGIDLPVYNAYYSKKARLLVIDKPIYVNELLKEGKSNDEIAELCLKKSHELCDYVKEEINKKKKK